MLTFDEKSGKNKVTRRFSCLEYNTKVDLDDSQYLITACEALINNPMNMHALKIAILLNRIIERNQS